MSEVSSYAGLKLQKQPTAMSCSQTCLAMMLDVPVEEVIRVYGGEGMSQFQFLSALSECGASWAAISMGHFVWSGWYFLSVPSRNKVGGGHKVILHIDVELGCSGMIVLDPSNGNCYAPNGSDLVSWSNVVAFRPGGRLPR